MFMVMVDEKIAMKKIRVKWRNGKTCMNRNTRVCFLAMKEIIHKEGHTPSGFYYKK